MEKFDGRVKRSEAESLACVWANLLTAIASPYRSVADHRLGLALGKGAFFLRYGGKTLTKLPLFHGTGAETGTAILTV